MNSPGVVPVAVVAVEYLTVRSREVVSPISASLTGATRPAVSYVTVDRALLAAVPTPVTRQLLAPVPTCFQV